MTTKAVRDQRVKAAEKKVAEAHEKYKKHQKIVDQATAEGQAAKRNVEWLKAMPVDDEPEKGFVQQVADRATGTNA